MSRYEISCSDNDVLCAGKFVHLDLFIGQRGKGSPALEFKSTCSEFKSARTDTEPCETYFKTIHYLPFGPTSWAARIHGRHVLIIESNAIQ